MMKIGVGLRDRDNKFNSYEIEARTLLEIMQSKAFRQGDVSDLISAITGEEAIRQEAPAPARFGYVFIDLIDNKIIDWQNFGGIKTIGSYELRLGLPLKLQHKIEIDRQRLLSDDIVDAYYYSKIDQVRKPINIPGPICEETYQTMVANIQKMEGSKAPSNGFIQWFANRVSTFKKLPQAQEPLQTIRFELDFPAWKYVNLERAIREEGPIEICQELHAKGLLDDDSRNKWMAHHYLRDVNDLSPAGVK